MGCGIFGIYRFQKNGWDPRPLIKELYIEAAVRGRDASGFAYSDGKQLCWHKLPMDPLQYSQVMVDQIDPNFKAFVGHTRAATHGKPEVNENNHPYVSDDFAFALVHNGVIQTPYKGGRELVSESDSERLLRQMEDELADMETPDYIEAMARMAPNFIGTACVAIVSAFGDWTLYRHNYPLFIGYLPDQKVLVFASTDNILMNAVNRIFRNLLGVFTPCVVREVPMDHQVILQPDGGIEFRALTWPVKRYSPPRTGAADWSQDWRGRFDTFQEHTGKRNVSRARVEGQRVTRKRFVHPPVTGLRKFEPMPPQAVVYLEDISDSKGMVNVPMEVEEYVETFGRNLTDDLDQLVEEGNWTKIGPLKYRSKEYEGIGRATASYVRSRSRLK